MFFEGDSQHRSSNALSTVHSIPNETVSAIIVEIHDNENTYNFEDHLFKIIIFQDSYDNIVKEIEPDSIPCSLQKYFLSVFLQDQIILEKYISKVSFL